MGFGASRDGLYISFATLLRLKNVYFHLLLSLIIRFVKTAFSSYQYVMFLFHFSLGQCHKLYNLWFDGGSDAVKGTEDRVGLSLVLWIASYVCSQTSISFLLTSIFKIYAQLHSLDID